MKTLILNGSPRINGDTSSLIKKFTEKKIDEYNINAVLIEDGLNQKERLIKLNKITIRQMLILEEQTTKILK